MGEKDKVQELIDLIVDIYQDQYEGNPNGHIFEEHGFMFSSGVMFCEGSPFDVDMRHIMSKFGVTLPTSGQRDNSKNSEQPQNNVPTV